MYFLYRALCHKGVSVIVISQMCIYQTFRQIVEIRDLLHQWMQWDYLESIARYRSVMQILFGILKDTSMRVRPVICLLFLDLSCP